MRETMKVFEVATFLKILRFCSKISKPAVLEHLDLCVVMA
jgi:hypothetical protein